MIRPIAEFLSGSHGQILDVRSPSEFHKGHIPGAINFPLFTDRERAEVGTCYKQEGPEPALVLGLEFVGPKMANFLRKAEELNPKKAPLGMYCFRGGQRSQSLAWLLRKAGHPVQLLEGGYKAYRRHVQASFADPQQISVLSGCTGCGKTRLLNRLAALGHQVIDLEAIAHHRGSAFGGYLQPDDLSSEMFENHLHKAWSKLDRERTLWLEDEGRNLGRLSIPTPFWQQMREAPVFFLDIPQGERVKELVKDYGGFASDLIRDSLSRISKRLGPQNTQLCLDALARDDKAEVARRCLDYYDKAYLYSLERRSPVARWDLALSEVHSHRNAEALLSFSASRIS